MIIPDSDNIRAAVDELKAEINGHWQEDQSKELHEAMGERSDDFKAGYQLGLQTARVVNRNTAELIIKGVDLTKLL